MNLSILHISDLHRDPNNLIKNDFLLDSLETDCHRFSEEEATKIRKPDLVIISGDIIYGVKSDDPDPQKNLEMQYTEALDFLSRITDSFVEGNRERVIIVPGNHDVSAHHFHKSMEKIDIVQDEKAILAGELFSAQSALRWSWSEFNLYKIIDQDMYNERMREFAAFYSSFYEQARTYDINPENQFGVFNYPEFGITVVGFSSCHNNDLYNKQGAINSTCIAAARKMLRAPEFSGQLRAAVWHHNTEGGPRYTDYMDSDLVQTLIEGEFSLGFHGHHHRPQFLSTRFLHGPNRKMVISSAGTLCGEPSFRHGRSYNIMEIDTAENTGRLHVREMQNYNLSLSIWGRCPIFYGDKSFQEFEYEAPPSANMARLTVAKLTEAQDLHLAKKYREAADIFAGLIQCEDLARQGFLDCLLKLEDRESIVKFFDPPLSAVEAIHLMDALWAQGKKERLSEVMHLPLIAESADPSLVEWRNKYKARIQ